MSTSTTAFVVAALLLLVTDLTASPAAAHPFGRFFPVPGRYRWRGWPRRHSPSPTTPPPPAPQQQCTCAPSAPTTTTTGTVTAADVPNPDPDDCVTPAVGLFPCFGFLTGSSGEEAPALGSACCAGLPAVLDSVAGSLSRLKCLCPAFRGVKPIDAFRVASLPTSCGVVFPPEVILLCLNTSAAGFVAATTP